jgi:hypothetical protein
MSAFIQTVEIHYRKLVSAWHKSDRKDCQTQQKLTVCSRRCNPPGYKSYFNGSTNADKKVINSQYVNILPDCQLPLSVVGDGVPEQFWNCAESKCRNLSLQSVT